MSVLRVGTDDTECVRVVRARVSVHIMYVFARCLRYVSLKLFLRHLRRNFVDMEHETSNRYCSDKCPKSSATAQSRKLFTVSGREATKETFTFRVTIPVHSTVENYIAVLFDDADRLCAAEHFMFDDLERLQAELMNYHKLLRGFEFCELRTEARTAITNRPSAAAFATFVVFATVSTLGAFVVLVQNRTRSVNQFVSPCFTLSR